MNAITVEQLKSRTDMPLIDVRDPSEFRAGHVPGAVNIPMSEIGDRLNELPTVAFNVICEIGGRSKRVAGALQQRGYEAANVSGGTAAWREAGYELEA